MSSTEETIDATLNADGQIVLARPAQLPPGPVKVTIRAAVAAPARPTIGEVIRRIAERQRESGFAGRSAAEIDARLAEERDADAERDRRLDEARRPDLRENP